MMMRTFSARNIQGVWFSLWLALPLLGQTGAARLARGIQEFENRKFGEAIQDLNAAQSPKLADYVAFYLASAHEELNDFEQARKDLAAFHKVPGASPLETRALLLEAKALAGTGSATEAVKLLKSRYDELPQPGGDFTLAQVSEAAGETAQSARYYQNVYNLYPLSDSAARAAKALDVLKPQMGQSYPQPEPQQRLERANRLLAARQYTKAGIEFAVLREELNGADRDSAAV